MDLFSDMIAAMQSDFTVDDTSTLYGPDTIKLALNRAKRKAEGLYKWPQMEDSKKTSSIAGHEYLDYPEGWRPNSIWKLSVGGIDYGDPIAFDDYRYEIENGVPSRRKQMWANQWLRYFMYPTPTVNGNFDIVIWGRVTPPPLVDDNDTTIFSYNMPEGNEAILLEANAILKNKGDLQQPVQRSFVSGSLLLSIEAENLLSTAWKRIQEEKSKYEKTQPLFMVPDFFRRGGSGMHNGDVILLTQQTVGADDDSDDIQIE